MVEANVFQPYFAAKRTDRTVAAAVWSGLVTLAPDGRYLPVLAASVPTTANGAVQVPGDGGDAMTVNWRLREGLRWSDGEPLECDDMAYAWAWVVDPDNVGVDRTGYEDISAVDCPSPTEMTWHFDRVYSAYLSLVPTPLPRHVLESIPMADQVTGEGFKPADLPKLPVSGPYRFVAATPGTELKLAANRSWLNPVTGRSPLVPALTWRWYGSPAALVAAFRQGSVDVATGLAGTDVVRERGLADRTLETPSLTYASLVLNWSGGAASEPGVTGGGTGCARGLLVASRGPGCPVSDDAIRSAIARTIDREAIVAEVLGGAGTVIDDVVPAEAWFAPALPPRAVDPGAASRALDDAGWETGPDGIRTKNGLRARIEICAPDDARSAAVAARISDQLRPVGIEAVADPVPADQLSADPGSVGAAVPCILGAGAFDAALVDRTSPVDPLGYFFAYHGSQIPPNGTNIAAISDDAIDAALDAVLEDPDPATVGAAIAAFERRARARVVELPLFRPTTADLVGAKIGNVMANPLQEIATWNVADWFRAR